MKKLCRKIKGDKKWIWRQWNSTMLFDRIWRLVTSGDWREIDIIISWSPTRTCIRTYVPTNVRVHVRIYLCNYTCSSTHIHILCISFRLSRKIWLKTWFSQVAVLKKLSRTVRQWTYMIFFNSRTNFLFLLFLLSHIYQYIYIWICLFVNLPIYLSIYLSIYATTFKEI